MAKIVGNPTVTPVMPSDWAQKDETKVDYIKNKPTKLSQFENDVEFVDREDLPYAEVAWADQAYDCYWAFNADCDGDGNPIVDTYATKEELGDIESVLDSILAIQETIVGGVN